MEIIRPDDMNPMLEEIERFNEAAPHIQKVLDLIGPVPAVLMFAKAQGWSLAIPEVGDDNVPPGLIIGTDNFIQGVSSDTYDFIIMMPEEEEDFSDQ